MSSIQQDIERLTHKFVEEIQQAIRLSVAQTLNGLLEGKPVKPKAASKAKPKAVNQQRVLEALQKSKRPTTIRKMAKTMGSSENRARQVLSELLRRRLVTARTLGDGTKRKEYLLAD